jgi:hypothetical protein
MLLIEIDREHCVPRHRASIEEPASKSPADEDVALRLKHTELSLNRQTMVRAIC